MIKARKFTAILVLAAYAHTYAHAQSDDVTTGGAFERITAIMSVILVVYIVAAFVLAISKVILNAWLKNKMIGKGIQDNVMQQLLLNDKKEIVLDALKWCIIFTGTGIGLLIISLFPPLGMHSIAIISFALAASFFVYFQLVKRRMK